MDLQYVNNMKIMTVVGLLLVLEKKEWNSRAIKFLLSLLVPVIVTSILIFVIKARMCQSKQQLCGKNCISNNHASAQPN